ncbi:MAG: MATE family efflux transporter [Candidatus Latescibacteria bacterium]|nr:MATE family efflux transporter [Candidatus Latescibacterota bacterium]
MRRRVFALAWPVIFESFLETSLGIVDTILVSRIGEFAIAGVGAAIQVLFFVIAILSALGVGSAVLVAQSVGAQRLDHAGSLARQSFLWGIVISIPLAIAGFFFSEEIAALFRLEANVAEVASGYIEITMGTAVVMTSRFLLGGVLRGAGDSRTPMLVTFGANIINVVLSYGLIFGYFGLPELGVLGSAWGTLIARILALAVILVVLWHGRNGVSIRGPVLIRPDIDIARQVLRIGVPAALEQLLITSAFSALTVAVAGLGTLTLAAHRITMNALSLSFLPGFGFGMAATSLVGQCIGAKRPDEAAIVARIATRWGMLWMSGVGVTVFLFGPEIMGIFSDNPEAVSIGSSGLRVVALAQPFWALIFIQSGAIRGTGDTRFPLRVNTIGVWTSCILAAVLIEFFDGGLAAVWASFIVIAPIPAGMLWWRFRRTMREMAEMNSPSPSESDSEAVAERA